MIQCCSSHFLASTLYRPPRDLQFRERNFRDLHVNHEIHENIVLQKLGAIRCLRGYWAFSLFLPSLFHPPPSFILPPSSYHLSSSLRPSPQDVTVLHHRFIDECFRRLDEVMDPTGGAGRTGSTGRNTSMLVTLHHGYDSSKEHCQLNFSPSSLSPLHPPPLLSSLSPPSLPLFHSTLPPPPFLPPSFLSALISLPPPSPPLPLLLPPLLSPSSKLQVQVIERLLLLAQRYIMVVEVGRASSSLSSRIGTFPSPPSLFPHLHSLPQFSYFTS